MAEIKERLRRTMMFVPGNNPAMVKDAGIYGADSIMFDLEDAVSMAEKDAARDLVYEALHIAGRTDLIGFDKKCLIRPRKTEHSYHVQNIKTSKKKKAIRNIHKKK